MQRSARRWLSAFLVVAALIAARSSCGATVELLDGTRIECKVLSKTETTVTIEVTSAGMLVKREIPLAKVHKVTINDKTYLITARSGAEASSAAAKETSAKSSSAAKGGDASAGGKATRTRTEVEALINELGRKPPEWFDATPLNYPQTLDLSWPEKPEGNWNNQRNVGQYVWDVINPNPGKWREGVKLMHHLLAMHKDDAEKRVRIMDALGRMYHNLHGDFARAAFWWRQAGVDKSGRFPGSAIHLAECYWRLGNKPMAADALKKLPAVTYDAIKLWADMGELAQALAIVNAAAKSPTAQLHFAYLYAGDACRVAGKHKEALDYYEKVLAVPAEGQFKGQVERCHQRAAANVEAVKLYDLSDVKKVADGTYRSQAIGYEGPIHVEVAVHSGRIESVRIVQHKEKQFYSAMTDTPAKVIAKQSVKGIDATSSATITSEAIINATAKALASGAK